MEIKTEAKLTTFEAICMIVGNSIGTGIIAVPYLATKNTIFSIAVVMPLAYIVNVILHLLIAELSYNNGGRQLVKSFERELFQGKKWIGWIFLEMNLFTGTICLHFTAWLSLQLQQIRQSFRL